MKHMRRAFALILTLVLVMSLGITAFAASPTGTIKVENTISGNEYKVYRIFDLVMQNHEGENPDTYAYKANNVWQAFIETVTYDAGAVNTNAMVRIGTDGFYHACDKDGKYVDTASTTWAANFGKLVKDWLSKNTVKEVATLTGNGSTVSQANFAYGYYYVSTTNGSLVALNTLDSTDKAEVTIGDKNVAPQLSKGIVSGETTVDANTAAVGDSVEFILKLTITQGTKNHVVHDVLSKGLTRNDDIVVTLKRPSADAKKLTADTDYKVSPIGSTADGGTQYNITFLAAAGLKKDDVVEITYSATVNDEALLHTRADNTMTNIAKLRYSTTADTEVADPDPTSPTEPSLPGETPEEKTVTYNFNVNVLKFTGDINAATKLAGAKFKLYSTEDGTDGYTFTESETGVYDLASATAAASVTELSTTDGGNLALNGLNVGTYYLEEIAAPAGYNKPTNRFKIVIKATPTASKSDVVITPSDSVTYDSTGEDLPSLPIDGVVAIQNNKGNELPHTGGVGTTIFYVGGAVLMVGALVLLITKKKLAAN